MIIKKQLKNPITLENRVLDKIKYLNFKCSNIEWSGVGVMKVEGDLHNDTLQLHVIDLLLKDVGTAGYTEYDWGTTLAEYFEENEDKWPVMFFSIHSHHNMGVTPSGVDDKHLYDNISNFPFHLSVIVNNKLDFNARIATDMVIESVSVRGMDSAYFSKQVNDGRIIVEYSLPVSISVETEEFKEEFEKVVANKKLLEEAKRVEPFTHIGKRTQGLQHSIPFSKPSTQFGITQYTLGTLNYKFTTIKEVLAELKTEDHVDTYLDQVEKICMDAVDEGKIKQVQNSLFQLMNTIESIAPNHALLNSIVYGLSAIHSLAETADMEDDFKDIPFNNKKDKDISRMTDKEWNEYINDRRY
jgi:hypothetical protein